MSDKRYLVEFYSNIESNNEQDEEEGDTESDAPTIRSAVKEKELIMDEEELHTLNSWALRKERGNIGKRDRRMYPSTFYAVYEIGDCIMDVS